MEYNSITLRIPVRDKAALKDILKAEEKLLKAGVMFDTGLDLSGEAPVRCWELDWSLEGAHLAGKGVTTPL